MKIGEMFIEMGIKGGSAFFAAMTLVPRSFENAAKSADKFLDISKKVYGGMDNYVYPIAKAGAELYEFEQATGISMVALQKWQKEMRNFGVSGDAVKGSMYGLQKAINNMIMGGGVPRNMALIFQQAGIDLNRIRDTTYLMEKLRDVAKTMDLGIGQTLFESLGLGPDMYQAMRRSTADINSITGDFFTKEQGKQLEKVSTMWDDMKAHAEKSFGVIIARHGPQLTLQITQIIDKMLKLVDVMIRVGNKLGVFEIMKKMFDGLNMAFNGIKSFFDYLDKMMGEGKGSLFEKALKLLDPYIDKMTEKMVQLMYPTPDLIPSPVGTLPMPQKTASSGPININQNITATGDPMTVKKAVASGTTSGIREAGAQMSSVLRKN